MEQDNLLPEKVQRTQAEPIDYRRLPDDQFFEGYANNVKLESSPWDFRLIFGNIEPAKGPNVVIQHTSMTLPWSQVKAGLYFLQIHLALHELINGKVHVPKGVVGPPVQPTEEQEKELPQARAAFETIRELFEKFSAANPESF